EANRAPVVAAAALFILPHDPSDDAGPRQVGNGDSNTGKFEFSGLPAGSYDMYARVQDPQGSPGRGGSAQAWGRASFEVKDRDIEDLRLVVHPSVEVNGILKLAGAGGNVK